jgi:hypothetical protein
MGFQLVYCMASFDKCKRTTPPQILTFDPSKTAASIFSKNLWLPIGSSPTSSINFSLGLHWDWEKSTGKERYIQHFLSYRIVYAYHNLRKTPKPLLKDKAKKRKL